MRPVFKPGDVLLGSALIQPKPGHVAVVKRKPLSIKRIRKINSNGVWVEGDNAAASTDSRSYGYIDKSDIKAVIFMKLF